MTRLNGLFAILLMLVVGCLPQAKQQSCSSGNVFSSNLRECVPITSGGTTNGVSITTRSPAVSNLSVAKTQATASAFTVTVNDSLNQGYLIKWVLYPPTGYTFTGNPVASNTASYNLIPSTAKAGGLDVGLWTLAAEITDATGASLLTSAQWTINVTAAPTPTLSYYSGSPTSSRLTTDATSTFYTAVAVTDTAPTATSWSIKWYYDGQLMKSSSSSGSKNPLSHGSTWHTNFSSSNALTADDPPITSVGPHTIRAELQNVSGTSVYDSKDWVVHVYAPNMPQITTTSGPSNSTVVTAIDGISIASGGFRVANVNLYNSSNSVGALCVTVNNYLGSGSGVNVEFLYDNNQFIGSATYQAPAALPTICLDDLASVAGTFALNLSNANVGEFRTITARIRDLATNTVAGSVAWGVSVRPKNTAPVASGASPTPSTLLIPGPLPFNPGGSFVVQLQDVAQIYSFSVTDDDTTSSDNMGIAYFIDGVAMDGVNMFPGTSVVTPDCTHTAGVAPFGATRLQCSIAIPSYDTTGRVDPRSHTYTITARASDQVTNGVSPLISNTLSWSAITVNPLSPGITQTSPTVADDLAANLCTPSTPTDVACPSMGNSYVSTLAAPAVKIASATEGDDIIFNVLVRDTERDDFRIGLTRLTSGTCAAPVSFQVVNADFLVTRSDDSYGRRVSIQHNIPESTVTSGASAAITYCVSVQDQLPDYNSDSTVDLSSAVVQTISLTVNNLNPFPVWAGPVSPSLASVLTVMTGMPLTLDPGTINDASTADGSVITYQWEVSTDAGVTWTSITGADERVLKWTPTNAIDGSAVQLRLCLGDDGTGNSLSLCTGIAAPTAPAAPATTRVVGPWTAITAKSNTIAKSGSTPTANGEVATWYDATEREMYMVFINKAGVNSSTIEIEKYEVALDGTIGPSPAETLSFPTEAPIVSAAAYDASRLSVVGQSVTVGAKTYRGLYISYVTQYAPSIAPQLRIRHVDLTDDEMLFDYAGSVFETDTTNVNITLNVAPIANSRQITVASNTFDVGETVVINGVPLTPIFTDPSPTAVNDCEFVVGDTSGVPIATTTIATNLELAFISCVGDDARAFVATGPGVVGSMWEITNFPVDWVDINYSIALGKAGDIMLHGTTLLIPYLDNSNAGKLSLVSLPTATGGGSFASGALGNSTTSPYSQVPVHHPFSATVQGLDLANSYGNSGLFDVALTTTANGLNAYRFSFTAPATVTLTNTATNVFGSGVFVEKPRIATGPTATNNNVFILAQDSASATHELNFARISVAAAYTIPSGLPMIPLDGVHEQSLNLVDYRISALSGNKRAALAVRTDDGVNRDMLVSLIKPITTSSEVPMIRPLGTAGTDYPRIEASMPAALTAMGMTPSFTLISGSNGSVTTDNNTEAVLVIYPTAAGTALSASFMNVTEESISATAIDSVAPAKFQPPYVQ